MTPLLSLISILLLAAGAPGSGGQPAQYLFLNRAPGRGFDQNRPDTVDARLFTEPLDALGTRGNAQRKIGVSFVLSYLNGPPDAIQETLRRLLHLSLQTNTPVLIGLDGENWWGYRSDLWNWWDPDQPGYNPKNVENVEWTDWGSAHAIKISWRNWGRQIRVLPQPNLGSKRFREASRRAMLPLLHILKEWADNLPADKRSLFPGVKIGWEASIGVNAYYYPDGNRLAERSPLDSSGDPPGGPDMARGFAGGLVPLGYAALTSRGWKHPGTVTLNDQERIVADYLTFLAGICRAAGFRREQVFTHAGGQYAPWELHMSHRVAINRYSLPGWSVYFRLPQESGDLGESLERAGLKSWAAAEWLPAAGTAVQWRASIDRTLAFNDCRFLSLYNWESIRDKPAALEGIRDAFR